MFPQKTEVTVQIRGLPYKSGLQNEGVELDADKA